MITWFKQAFAPWLMENFRAIALVIGCATALYFIKQHEQFVMYALPIVIFGYGLLHGVVELLRNPVKEETKMQKLLAGTVEGLKIEAIVGEDFALHLKHLLEKHLGYAVVITPAPVIAPTTPQV